MPDAGSSASPAPARRIFSWPAAGIFAATLVAYLPAWRGGFLWDDGASVTGAAFHSWHALVLHGAFWIEHRLWGEAPLGYHLTNILLHAAAACLFARVLQRLAIPGAWLAALIFALHPVCVESVAWIGGQSNPLSTVFYLLATLAYLDFDREREPLPYFSALGLFLVSVLSASPPTLPAALLVVVWWRRGRLTWWQDVVPMLPFLVLGVGAWFGHPGTASASAVSPASGFALTLWERYLQAGRAFWFYADKLLWPVHLVFFYPRWTVNAAAAWQYSFPLGLIALLLALWTYRDSTRGPLAAALFFLVSLFPFLGFLPLAFFRYSLVSDPFAYLANLGIIALAAAAFAQRLGRLPPVTQWPGRVFAALVVLALGGLTWRQSGSYRDPATFYRAIVANNPDAWMAHDRLGLLDRAAGDLPGAIEEFSAAARLQPRDAANRDHLGAALADAGRLPEAIEEFEASLRLEPAEAKIQEDLGNALFRSDRPAEALPHYQESLRLQPDDAAANFNLGRTLSQLGQPAEAIGPLQRALALRPEDPEEHTSLGNALTAVDRLPEAIGEFQEALRLRPGDLEAHFNLGIVLLQLGKSEDAKAQFNQVLQINPDYRPARDALDRLTAPPSS